jgi:hypothetical protein
VSRRKRRIKIDGDPIFAVGGFNVVKHYATDTHGHGPVVVALMACNVDSQGRGEYTKTGWRPYLRSGS